jgi:hypothetical protein
VDRSVRKDVFERRNSRSVSIAIAMLKEINALPSHLAADLDRSGIGQRMCRPTPIRMETR